MKSDAVDIVADFTRHRLKKSPVEYTVIFRHDDEGMSFVVYDIQDTKKDRLAVARDLEDAAKSLTDDFLGVFNCNLF